MASKRIVIIGGSAAGPKAACKAKRVDPDAEVTIIQRAPDLSMASCGYPYYLRDGFDRNLLVCTPVGVVRDAAFYRIVKDISALVSTEVRCIDRANKRVQVHILNSGEQAWVPYDKLVIATGASPVVPSVAGADLDGVHTLWSLQDTDRIKQRIEKDRPRKAVIIGGGLVGMEMCEALHHLGVHITVVEKAPHILAFLDVEMASVVEKYVREKGVDLVTRTGVESFHGVDGRLTEVCLEDGRTLPCEFALVSVGVRPNTEVARAAGLELGRFGGIKVNAHLQTSDSDIYAAGDCIEISHLVSGQERHIPLGDLANLQGRVVGQNVILGNVARYPGAIGTGACKIFDLNVGSTGLSEEALRRAGDSNSVAVVISQTDLPGYMGGKLLVIKLIAAKTSGKILGMQAVGLGDASKRVAVAATAIYAGLTVEAMANLDLPYAPPYSQAIDPIIVAAHALQNKQQGWMQGLTTQEVLERVASEPRPYLLDVRSPPEYEEMRLDLGEQLIPLGKLRNSGRELPADRSTEIIAYCKTSLRGYEAAILLQAMGYKNVKVMEGGLVAWPGKLTKGPRERSGA